MSQLHRFSRTELLLGSDGLAGLQCKPSRPRYNLVFQPARLFNLLHHPNAPCQPLA